MSKNFFVVVPYTPPVLGGGGKSVASKLLPNRKNKEEKAADASASFEEDRSQLQQRVEVVEQGLVRCGIRIVELGTEELIELFYKIFNPGDVDKPIHVGQDKR